MRLVTARRLAVSFVAASLLAVLPATAGAKSAAGWFKLPAGDAFSLTNTYLWGCDSDSYAYKFGNQPRVILGNNAGSLCDQDFQPDVLVGPFSTNREFRLLLIDTATTPPYKFFSPDANHTSITGTTDDWQIQIGDSNFGAAPPSVVYHSHNLSTTLTIGTPCTAAATAPNARRVNPGGRPTPNC
jgi:hypothetical protein